MDLSAKKIHIVICRNYNATCQHQFTVWSLDPCLKPALPITHNKPMRLELQLLSTSTTQPFSTSLREVPHPLNFTDSWRKNLRVEGYKDSIKGNATLHRNKGQALHLKYQTWCELIPLSSMTLSYLLVWNKLYATWILLKSMHSCWTTDTWVRVWDAPLFLVG